MTKFSFKCVLVMMCVAIGSSHAFAAIQQPFAELSSATQQLEEKLAKGYKPLISLDEIAAVRISKNTLLVRVSGKVDSCGWVLLEPTKYKQTFLSCEDRILKVKYSFKNKSECRGGAGFSHVFKMHRIAAKCGDTFNTMPLYIEAEGKHAPIQYFYY